MRIRNALHATSRPELLQKTGSHFRIFKKSSLKAGSVAESLERRT